MRMLALAFAVAMLPAVALACPSTHYPCGTSCCSR